MRSFGSILWTLLVVIVLAGIGVGIYDAGLQQGIAQSANVPAGTVPAYAYGYGWHGGGGILGLLFPILFLFILFGIARAAFGHRRGWGHGYGPGYGKWGYGPGAWMGQGGPGSGSPRDQWVAEMHRRLHEAEGTSPSGSTGTGPGTGTGNSAGTGTPPAG